MACSTLCSGPRFSIQTVTGARWAGAARDVHVDVPAPSVMSLHSGRPPARGAGIGVVLWNHAQWSCFGSGPSHGDPGLREDREHGPARHMHGAIPLPVMSLSTSACPQERQRHPALHAHTTRPRPPVLTRASLESWGSRGGGRRACPGIGTHRVHLLDAPLEDAKRLGRINTQTKPQDEI